MRFILQVLPCLLCVSLVPLNMALLVLVFAAACVDVVLAAVVVPVSVSLLLALWLSLFHLFVSLLLLTLQFVVAMIS